MCTLMSVLRGPGHQQTSHLLGSVRPRSALVPAQQGWIFFAYGWLNVDVEDFVSNNWYYRGIGKSLQNSHPWSAEVSCILKCIAKTRARALISVHRPSLAAWTARAPSEFLWKYRRVTSKLSSIVPAYPGRFYGLIKHPRSYRNFGCMKLL